MTDNLDSLKKCCTSQIIMWQPYRNPFIPSGSLFHLDTLSSDLSLLRSLNCSINCFAGFDIANPYKALMNHVHFESFFHKAPYEPTFTNFPETSMIVIYSIPPARSDSKKGSITGSPACAVPCVGVQKSTKAWKSMDSKSVGLASRAD